MLEVCDMAAPQNYYSIMKSHSMWKQNYEARIRLKNSVCFVAEECAERFPKQYEKCGKRHDYRKRICTCRGQIMNGKEYAEDLMK